MDQVIDACAERRFRGGVLCCVHCERDASRVRFVRGRLHDRFLRRKIACEAIDDPDLDVVGLAGELPLNECTRPSMSPGTTHLPCASMIVAPAGTAIVPAGPTAAI